MCKYDINLPILVIYNVLVILLLMLTLIAFRVHNIELSAKELLSLKINTFEIIVAEMYSYYFTVNAIIFQTKRSMYMHVWIYFYHFVKIMLYRYEPYVLLTGELLFSTLKCAFVYYYMLDDTHIPISSGQQVMDFTRYLIKKIKELKNSAKEALYFFWIKDAYLLLIGDNKPDIVLIFFFFVISDFFRVVRECPSKLRYFMEMSALAVAFFLEIRILVTCRNKWCALTTAFEVFLLFGSILLTVIIYTAESSAVSFSLGESQNRDRWNKLSSA